MNRRLMLTGFQFTFDFTDYNNKLLMTKFINSPNESYHKQRNSLSKLPLLLYLFKGFTFGSTIGQPIAGYMSSSWWGWPSSFYLYGCFGLVWTVLWIIFGASSPAEHRSIMASEKHYIESSLGVEDDQEVSFTYYQPITERASLKSLNIYSLIILRYQKLHGNIY